MPPRSDFAGLVEELLQPVGPVEVRAMFGGHGVFVDGVMFGLIADDELYLKVDDGNRAQFVDAGLDAFVYQSSGRAVTMSYHRAPDVLEDWERLEPWVASAIDASRRARRAVSPKRRAR
jgi:DNA transformation protein and related proteins